MPPAGTVLTAGTSVTFTATATYNLPVAGSIVLVIEDQNYDNLSTTNPAASAQVGAGTGTVTLSDRITLPPSGVTQVDLFVLLASAPVQNISVSSIAQETVYPVH